ncbi:MAG: 50S ribosomal protein L30e [Desulfurococcales archaeon]|nr:50S ribosomal protein L30e [Desulfurococcales archaeon]
MSTAVTRELKNLVKTGVYVLGSRQSIRAVAHGKAKLLIIAKNARPDLRDRALYLAKLSGVPVYTFPGTSVELGVALGKPFRVSMLAVIDEGSSQILRAARQASRQ